MKKYIKIGLLILSGTIFSWAEDIDVNKTPSERAELFLSTLDDNANEAFDVLVGNGLLAQPLYQSRLLALKMAMPETMKLLGQKMDTPFQKLKEKDVTTSMKVLVYTQNYEWMPITWYFNFYKADQHWDLIKVVFSTEFPIFEE